jgi:tRNA pseudouridine32 synthase/23S rRNA pseudouridine746 synthase
MKPIFENEHFLILDKPAGSLVIPARERSAETDLSLIETLRKERGEESIYVVHRLDREVSGIVLFAKTKEAHRESNRWFEEHLVQKTYQALTEKGAELLKAGEWVLWRSNLVRGKKRTFEAEHGKLSITEACLIEVGAKWCEFRLRPRTGRTHQLRVELSKRGYVILGDKLYGAKTVFRENEIALRAVELDFSSIRGSRDFMLPEKISVKGLL